MKFSLSKNMGIADRSIRGVAGFVMLMDGILHPTSSLRQVESLVGGAFLLYALTGYDPLLALTGASTQAGKENNVLHQIKAALPGQGIQPVLTQNVLPRVAVKPFKGGAFPAGEFGGGVIFLL